MAIKGILQPEQILITETLQLRKYDGNHSFALAWYQDSDMVLLVDGQAQSYDANRLNRMYQYLEAKGELYFIEAKASNTTDFAPIGDVTFCQQDMPIVIGSKQWRGKGIGRQVIQALVDRARTLGWSYLEVEEIYDYNTASQKAFASVGFRPSTKTEKGHSYCLEL